MEYTRPTPLSILFERKKSYQVLLSNLDTVSSILTHILTLKVQRGFNVKTNYFIAKLSSSWLVPVKSNLN